jgi:hypothetical protein
MRRKEREDETRLGSTGSTSTNETEEVEEKLGPGGKSRGGGVKHDAPDV